MMASGGAAFVVATARVLFVVDVRVDVVAIVGAWEAMPVVPVVSRDPLDGSPVPSGVDDGACARSSASSSLARTR